MALRLVALGFVALGFVALGLLPAVAGAQSADRDPDAALAEAKALLRATEYEPALRLLEREEAAAARRGDPRWQARFASWRGRALANSGAHDRARPALEQAARILLGLDAEDARAEGLGFRAESRRMAGDIAGALTDFAAAAAAYRRLGREVDAARVDAAASAAAASNGRVDEALARGLRALPILEQAGQDDARAAALSGIAYALHQSGRQPQALTRYDELIRLAGEQNDQQTLLFAYCNRAEIQRQSGELEAAEDGLRRAIGGFETTRAALVGTASERASYLERQVAAYDRLILLLADSYRGLEAFPVAERFHARSFVEMLDRRSLQRAVGADPRLGARQEEILDRLGAARLDSAPDRTAQTRRREIERLEAELIELEIEIRRSNPRYAGLTAPQPPTLEAVQAGLEPGEALVAYWVSAERVLAWAVTRSSAHMVQLPVSRNELVAAIADYLEPLRSPHAAEDAALAGSERAHLETGRRLARWLIESLPRTVRDAGALILVPDDVLHYLPFESLPISCPRLGDTAHDESIHGVYRGCDYLGLSRALTYSPSAGALLALRRRDGSSGDAEKSLLALAPVAAGPLTIAGEGAVRSALDTLAPLREAEREAQRVAELFPGARLLVDAHASESRFKASAGDYRYLHLATHGLVVDELPMTSGLLLAPGAGDDGLLQAYEVLGLDLQADVVTLSACRTGRGELSRGEGIVGLSHAFLYAGAASVLVSMWDVDDRSTALLMTAFYRHLAAGASRAEALRAARADLFARSSEGRLVFRTRPLAYAHPRFWAPFVLVGESVPAGR